MRVPIESATDPALPPEVEDRSAWYGQELAKCEDWIERLSEVEIAEVEHAFRQLDAKRIDFTSITADEVSLPTLAIYRVGPTLSQCGTTQPASDRGTRSIG